MLYKWLEVIVLHRFLEAENLICTVRLDFGAVLLNIILVMLNRVIHCFYWFLVF